MEVLLTFLAGWLSTLSGVALGGWLVYRTKRDPYDPLFASQGKGEVFNIDDDFNISDDDKTTTGLPKPTKKANEAFVQKFADDLAEKVAG